MTSGDTPRASLGRGRRRPEAISGRKATRTRVPGSALAKGSLSSLLVLLLVLSLIAVAVIACDSDGSSDRTTEPPEDLDTVVTDGGPSTDAFPGETTEAEVTTSTETTSETGGDTTTSSAEETTTTASSVPQTTSTTEKLISGEIRLEDGKIKVMGFIDKVWEADGKRWIRIDYAEFLTGDEAREAAIKAGELSPGEELPNDYYIRNQSHTLREYQVSKSVQITTSSWHGVMEAAATWEEFKAFWSDSPPDPEAALLKESPWWIVRDGSVVLRIDEQYLP